MTILIELVSSSGEIDHEPAEDLQRFQRDETQEWLKIVALFWTYKIPMNLPLLYIQKGTRC